MRTPILAVGLVALLGFAAVGCACENQYCDDTGCYFCDGYGCRPIGPTGGGIVADGGAVTDGGTGADGGGTVADGGGAGADGGGTVADGGGGGGTSGGRSCTRSSDCGVAGWQCRNGACVLPCSSNTQCGLSCTCTGGFCGTVR